MIKEPGSSVRQPTLGYIKTALGCGCSIVAGYSDTRIKIFPIHRHFRFPSCPSGFLLHLHLITAIMRLPAVGLFELSLAVASLVVGSSLNQDITRIVERQANASSLNATLLQVFEDIEEAKNCNDCEARFICNLLEFFC